MRGARVLAAALAALAFAAPRPAAGDGSADVVRYELDVMVRDDRLEVAETIRFAGRAPSRLVLDLVPEMKVLGAECDGKPAAVEVLKEGITLDLSGATASDTSVALRVAGAPREQFSESRGGFLRSAVGPDFAYVRSQVAWYPRVRDDLATYRIVVNVPSGRAVRTAGIAEKPVRKGDSDVFTFESPIPAPAIGLVAGAWKSRELGASGGAVFEALHLPGREKGADALLAAAKRAFDVYGVWFGKAPFARFTLVEMPESFGSASGYGESGYALLGPGAFASPPGVAAVALVAHEVSHTWWGHEVRFSEWANEALASFTTMKFLEADQGADAARDDRRSSVEQVVRAAEAGKEIALAGIRGFGGGMDPETYASHAYGKGKMLLLMVEDAIGEAAMRKLLARFVEANRGRTVGWPEVRAALVGAGPAAKAAVEQWETTGVPRLTVDLAKTQKPGKVSGTLRQEGTTRPYRMNVILAATCGDRVVTATAELDGKEVPFEFAAPSAPTSVVVDPEWRLLAARPAPGGEEAAQLFDEGMRVANTPGESDLSVLAAAIAKLRKAIASGSPDLVGTCRVGIGRCLFNLGKLDEAKKELEEGLRDGCGPFHRAWANLRLGNIADLQKRRKDAVRIYEAVIAAPAAKSVEFQKERAKRFLGTPYRSFREDG